MGYGNTGQALDIHFKRILKAPIKMTNGTITYPEKGTPQGIISPLLANIVLNELDHWVESQWQENPVTKTMWFISIKAVAHVKATLTKK